MTTLAIVEDWIEFEGRRIARLEPGLPPTLVYRMEAAFDFLDDDELGEAELDEELERLIRALDEGGRPRSLADRMARARMRLVAQKPDAALNGPGSSPTQRKDPT